MPNSIAEIRTALVRERRGRMLDRRTGRVDTRVFQYDRRRGDRREEDREDDVLDLPSLRELIDGRGSDRTLTVSPTSGSVSDDDGDELALDEIAMQIATDSDMEPEPTCIRDVGWAGRSSGTVPRERAADT